MKNTFVSVFLVSLLISLAGAADNYFQPAGGVGNWNVASNWSLGRVPEDIVYDDTARIKDGYVCNVDSIVPNCFKLYCGNQGDATLNIYDGADLYVVNGIIFGYVSGTCNVNMYGGSFADYGRGESDGWTGWGWNGTFNWYQEGGDALFFVNGGYGPTNIDVVGGSLILAYSPHNNETTDAQDFYVSSGGMIQMGKVGGNQSFTVDIGGTMRIKTAYWSEFVSRVTYIDTPDISIDGQYTVVEVIGSGSDNYFQPSGGSGNWDVAANWSLGHVPDYNVNSYSAVITDGYECDVNSNVPLCTKLDVGNYGDATLNIHDGGYLYATNGVMFGYSSGTVNVNMLGGNFTDTGPESTGWTGWGWNGDFHWYQEGGVAQFFVNGGYGPVYCEVVGGELNLSYQPINNDTEDYWIFYVADGGVITMGAIGGLQVFTIGVCGTMKINSAYWSEFESRVTYLGTPHIKTEGNFKVVSVSDEVDFYTDCEIDFRDCAFLASKWLNKNCVADDWCDGADVDKSGEVDVKDLNSLVQKWLDTITGTGPELIDSYYVATDGDDSNPGTEAEPFKTLEKARDTIRLISELPQGGVTVYMREGKYFRSSKFQLTSQDSGESDKRITYRNYPGETVRIIGGAELDPAWFSTVNSSSGVWSRIADAAKGNVMQVYLPDHGITSYGQLVKRGFNVGGAAASELFFNTEPMQISRWPNSSFKTVLSVPGGTHGKQFSFSDGTGLRPALWLTAEDPWFFGYWYYGWADLYSSASSFDVPGSIVTLTYDPQFGIITGAPFFALNMLEEIDMAGEWYLNRSSGYLYFWPPSDISSAEIYLSTNSSGLLEIESASNITFSGLTFEMGWTNVIKISNGSDNVVSDCVIRNGGNNGVSFINGQSNSLIDCKVSGMGDKGIILNGGNRYTLTPSNHLVENCEIYNFSRWTRTYRPAIELIGVGNIARHNLMYHGPHSAIIHKGNDNIMEYNHFYDICYETDDAGVIYSGRDWGKQGNIVRYSLFHDIQSGLSGAHGISCVYMDDCVSGDLVFGNVFYDITGRAIFSGGGRDNIMQNNVIVKCNSAHLSDRRGTIKINNTPGSSWNLLEKIQTYNYQNPPWSTAYPELALTPNNYYDPGFDYYRNPVGCEISRTIGWQNTKWLDDSTYGGSGCFGYYTITNNLSNSNPLFVDEGNLNLALRDDSPAYTLSGFVRIPFERIGLRDQIKATKPNPSNGKTGVSTTLTLYWAEASQSTSRDVYFGTSFGQVSSANNSSGAFKGNITDYDYSPTGLVTGSTYYWRIDERNAAGVMGKGDVWSFTTIP